ncbi:MAG: hypothetical protein LBH43_13095 [Treponema sp.]|jgi:hypothetical protein|nr:hypothetical protein [Treponema sp.]
MGILLNIHYTNKRRRINKTSHNIVEQANEILKNTLLQSLQMPHLVVLAGSGCSIYAGGPSMRNIWDIVIDVNLKNTIEQVAKKVHHDLGDKNIEIFLSKAEAFFLIKEELLFINF